MHPLARELLHYASTLNNEGLNGTMRKISKIKDLAEQKEVILSQNKAKFNAFQAAVGSRDYKKDPQNGDAVINRILNKAAMILNPNEYKGFCTSTTKKGLTAGHLAVRNGAYNTAVMVLQETNAIYQRSNDENGFQEYLNTESNLNNNLMKTYEGNIKHSDIDSAPHQPNAALDNELYGEDFQRQNHTKQKANFSSRVAQSRQNISRANS